MVVSLPPSMIAAWAQDILDALDAGPGPGYVEYYNGTMPADPTVAVTTQTKLATLVLSDPAATYSNKVITFNGILQDNSADANGTPTWARFKDSTGAAVMDVDVGDLASNAVIKVTIVPLVAGGPVLINSMLLVFA